MGLDQYLNKMPRYKNATANDVYAIECYLDLIDYQKKGEYKDSTLKEWCGIDESKLPAQDVIDYYKQFYGTKYYDFDTEKKYPHNHIIEEVGYLRKANAIHAWFVERVQDGIDDCHYHNEVTKEILEELLDICVKVYESCTMIVGAVHNGDSFINGEWTPNIEPGKVVIDPSVAEELLPTCSGFFFGSTSYDEYYVESIRETIEMINVILDTTDFDNEMIYYVSSW